MKRLTKEKNDEKNNNEEGIHIMIKILDISFIEQQAQAYKHTIMAPKNCNSYPDAIFK